MKTVWLLAVERVRNHHHSCFQQPSVCSRCTWIEQLHDCKVFNAACFDEVSPKWDTSSRQKQIEKYLQFTQYLKPLNVELTQFCRSHKRSITIKDLVQKYCWLVDNKKSKSLNIAVTSEIRQ